MGGAGEVVAAGRLRMVVRGGGGSGSDDPAIDFPCRTYSCINIFSLVFLSIGDCPWSTGNSRCRGSVADAPRVGCALYGTLCWSFRVCFFCLCIYSLNETRHISQKHIKVYKNFERKDERNNGHSILSAK